MRYEPVFKLPYSNIFITDLFLPAYGEFDPIVTIKNGKWEFFLSDKVLNKVAEIGFLNALKEGTYKSFEERYKIFVEKIKKLKTINIENLSNNEFIAFIKDFKAFVYEFFDTYRETEFFYFTKIEKEINDYIQNKFSFDDVLSNKINLASWPEEKRKLADYIIGMQHLKFEYRKLMNDVAIGKDSILSKIMEQLIIRTKRDDATSMNVEEIVNLLNGNKIKDFSDRHVYSFVQWNNEQKRLIIFSG